MPLILISDIRVPKNGYSWLKHPNDGGLDRLDCNPLGQVGFGDPISDFKTYDPFREERALFLIFAGLDIGGAGIEAKARSQRAHDQVLGFVNKYGAFEVADLRLSDIIREIDEMRAVILLWRAIKTQDYAVDPLWDYYWRLRRGENTQYRQKIEETNENLINPAVRENRLGQWQREFGDIFPDEASKLADDSSVNSAISDNPGSTQNKLDWAKNLLANILKNRLGTLWELDFRPTDKGRLDLAVITSDLQRALWLQLALAISENREYRHCETCRKPYLVSEKTDRRQQRADKIYCSDKCRMKALNQRKKLAKSLRAQGMDIVEIAQKLETTMENVTKWVAEGG
jgi:hypothetical protein